MSLDISRRTKYTTLFYPTTGTVLLGQRRTQPVLRYSSKHEVNHVLSHNGIGAARTTPNALCMSLDILRSTKYITSFFPTTETVLVKQHRTPHACLALPPQDDFFSEQERLDCMPHATTKIVSRPRCYTLSQERAKAKEGCTILHMIA